MLNDHIIFSVKHVSIGAFVKKLQALVWTCVKHANMEGFCRASHKYVKLPSSIALKVYTGVLKSCSNTVFPLLNGQFKKSGV